MKKFSFKVLVLACSVFISGGSIFACGESENVTASQSDVLPTYYAYSYIVKSHDTNGMYFAENKDNKDYVIFDEGEIKIGDDITVGDTILGIFDKDDNLISIEKYSSPQLQ
jgi:hypothetical protein